MELPTLSMLTTKAKHQYARMPLSPCCAPVMWKEMSLLCDLRYFSLKSLSVYLWTPKIEILVITTLTHSAPSWPLSAPFWNFFTSPLEMPANFQTLSMYSLAYIWTFSSPPSRYVCSTLKKFSLLPFEAACSVSCLCSPILESSLEQSSYTLRPCSLLAPSWKSIPSWASDPFLSTIYLLYLFLCPLGLYIVRFLVFP